MADLRETLSNLFLDVAILEHLSRSRIQRHHKDGMVVGQYGILGYLIRQLSGSDSIVGIAWAFQEEPPRIAEQVQGLRGLGYVHLTDAINPFDAAVSITPAGRLEHEAVLERAAPEFYQIVSEIPFEDIETAQRVLREIRLVMDNLPDR